MIRKGISLFLCCFLAFSGAVKAQFCGTEKMNQAYKEAHPEIVAYQMALEKQIKDQMKLMDISKMARTTAFGDTIITIPVIVHVLHDYGTENVPDADIFRMLANLNDFYNTTQIYNDTSVVIAPFKKYVGTARIKFRLATKDPIGQPTKGIKRYYSYLTYGSDDFAKIDIWNPHSYMNIWVESFIGLNSEGGGIVAAYAVFPSAGAALPWSDGVMTNSQFITTVGNDAGAVIPHEVGHYLNLEHTFGGYNKAGAANGVPCGDDEVDDTPPTHGNEFGCDLYDTSCAQNYFKVYPSSISGVDSLVDYPDTCNVQNIMNYADCKAMFTKGQVVRMRASLNSSTANRDSLWTPYNLWLTGANASIPDLKPVADFSIQNGLAYTKTRTTRYFLTVNNITKFYFKNQSWNDTVTKLDWIFPNGAPATQTVTSGLTTAIPVSFSTPGWANVTLVAHSNAGDDTTTKAIAYVADPNGVAPESYYQEFNTGSGSDLDKWPIFNYYENSFKWQLNNTVGFYDHNCIMYSGWDYRTFPATYTGSPKGEFNDFFSCAFNLSAWASSANCNINFMYAGTYKSGVSLNMNDTLEISYSVDGGASWVLFDTLKKSQISSTGSLGVPFSPSGFGDWALHSKTIPVAGRGASTFFRFRYKPGTDKYGNSTSNNFYLDRFNISNNPVGVNTILQGKNDIVILPNPTSSNAYVLIKEQNANSAKIIVSDVTGKQVYTVEQQLVDGAARIEIPASSISVKGMYMVQVISGGQSHTDKLVVY